MRAKPVLIPPGEVDCPKGEAHQMVRRERTLDDGSVQDGMFCMKCEGCLYPWKTIRSSLPR